MIKEFQFGDHVAVQDPGFLDLLLTLDLLANNMRNPRAWTRE
jgi:hypothetical protein